MKFDLRKLQLFAAVLDDGSMSRTARRLNIAQSALSRHIKELETAVGGELLQRSSAGVSPTPLGKKVRRHCRAVLAAVEKMQFDLSMTRPAKKASLSLGVTSSAATFLSGILRQRLSQRLKLTEMSMTEGPSEHLRSLVLSGQLDLAIVTNFSASQAVRVLASWREGLCLVAPTGKRRHAAPELRDLQRLPFVLTSKAPGVRTTFEQVYQREGLMLRVDLELESLRVAMQMVEQGAAYTILPFSAVSAEAAQGRVNTAMLNGAYFTRALLCRSGRSRGAALRQATAALVHELETELSNCSWVSNFRQLSG